MDKQGYEARAVRQRAERRHAALAALAGGFAVPVHERHQDGSEKSRMMPVTLDMAVKHSAIWCALLVFASGQRQGKGFRRPSQRRKASDPRRKDKVGYMAGKLARRLVLRCQTA